MLGLLSSAAKFSIACFHKSKDLLTTYDDDDDDEYESVGGHPRGGSRVLMFEKPDTAVVLSWHSAQCAGYSSYALDSIFYWIL